MGLDSDTGSDRGGDPGRIERGDAGPPGQGRQLATSSATRTSYILAKRAVDLTVGGLALLVLLPVLIGIALAVKLDSRGPVFFSHMRVGSRPVRRPGRTWTWETRRFPMYKFRSMTHGGDDQAHREHVAAWVQGRVPKEAGFKMADDERITRVGRVLRRTSLDELPQLINVVKGEMSLIGPRPVPDYEVALYDDWHFERLCAKPGMSGLWQVEGRGVTSLDEMVRLDIEYVHARSIALDLRLLALTLPAVIGRRGAR